jgi:hypothetical protein
LKIIDPLANPTAHGASASDAFDVVRKPGTVTVAGKPNSDTPPGTGSGKREGRSR